MAQRRIHDDEVRGAGERSGSLLRSRRRRVRLLIGALLVFVLLVVGIPIAWIGHRAHRAAQVREVAKLVESLGGDIYYQVCLAGGPPIRSWLDPPGPEWLTRTFGEHLFLEPVKLNLDRTNVTDADLRCLKELSSLQGFSAWDTRISDRGMEYVGDLTALQDLGLYGTPVGDDGIAHISKLHDLRHLWLGETPITDASLSDLANLTKLKSLDLNGTNITDAGLKHLRRMQDLELLVLGQTAITNSGLAHLRELHSLRILGLRNTRVDNRGLAHLEQLENLEELRVVGTGVTADGIEELDAKLPKSVLHDLPYQGGERGNEIGP